MKHKIIVEIDGVRHKLIKTKTKVEDPCDKCSILNVCRKIVSGFMPCTLDLTCYRKCKKGE